MVEEISELVGDWNFLKALQNFYFYKLEIAKAVVERNQEISVDVYKIMVVVN